MFTAEDELGDKESFEASKELFCGAEYKETLQCLVECRMEEKIGKAMGSAFGEASAILCACDCASAASGFSAVAQDDVLSNPASSGYGEAVAGMCLHVDDMKECVKN